jgi:hypothetical protein
VLLFSNSNSQFLRLRMTRKEEILATSIHLSRSVDSETLEEWQKVVVILLVLENIRVLIQFSLLKDVADIEADGSDSQQRKKKNSHS